MKIRKYSIVVLLWCAYSCFSLGMEQDISKSKEEPEITINQGSTSLTLRIVHSIAQKLADYLLEDKALKLVDCPSFPFLKALSEFEKSDIEGIIQYVVNVVKVDTICEQIFLVLTFHVLFSQESEDYKLSYLSKIISKKVLSKHSLAFFRYLQFLFNKESVIFGGSFLHELLRSIDNLVSHRKALLCLAAKVNAVAIMDILFSLNANRKPVSRKDTNVLSVALEHNSPEAVSYILERAEIDLIEYLRDSDSFWSVLFSALFKCKDKQLSTSLLSLIERLIARENLNGEGYKKYYHNPHCIPHSSFFADSSINFYLAAALGDISCFNNENLDFGSFASTHGIDYTVEEFSKDSLLHTAARFGQLQILALLLKRGANKEAQNKAGYTPLVLALVCGQLDAAKLLLDEGADKDVCIWSGGMFDRMQMPLLHYLTQEDSSIGVKFLLDYGVPVDLKGIEDDSTGDKGMHTALYYAIKNGNETLIRFLLERGAAINVRWDNGSTPLHRAVLYNHFEIVKLLVENGASIDARDKNGNTPLDIAKKQEHQALASDDSDRNIAEWLKEQMAHSKKDTWCVTM
jgi:ankyrin repeat protein